MGTQKRQDGIRPTHVYTALSTRRHLRNGSNFPHPSRNRTEECEAQAATLIGSGEPLSLSGSNDACSSSALLRTVAFVPSNQRSKDYGVGILRNRVRRD